MLEFANALWLEALFQMYWPRHMKRQQFADIMVRLHPHRFTHA